MTLKFVYYPNKDKGDLYLKTLLDSGLYEQVPKITNADFLIADYEGRCPVDIAAILKQGKCAFIYPHAALTFISYDGMYPSNLNVTTNFVPSYGQRVAMWKYGYKCKVVPVGWSYSPIRPFAPMPNDDLRILYAPEHDVSRTRKRFRGSYGEERWKQNADAFDKLLEIPNSKLTVYYANDMYKDQNIVPGKAGVTYIKSDLRMDSAIKLIDSGKYNLVVAFDTFAWISVAMGMPTLMYGQDLRWHGVLGPARHWDDYKNYIRYPYELLSQDFTPDIIPEIMKSEKKILDWKDRFIGIPFDADFFLETLKSELDKAEQIKTSL